MLNNKIKIVSGGQTGVDQAALDVAMQLGLPCGGWCPKGRKAELGGIIDQKYPLIETPLDNYEQRTEWNVRDSDGTLILMWDKPSAGTQLTIELAKKFNKPLQIVDMKKRIAKNEIIDWIAKNKIYILNVAGPRGSFGPHIYKEAQEYLTEILKNYVIG